MSASVDGRKVGLLGEVIMSNALGLVSSWLAVAMLGVACGVQAQALNVLAPHAVKEAMLQIATRFEKETRKGVNFSWGGSEAIGQRMAAGEVFDVVVSTAAGVDRMVAEGLLIGGTRVDFSRSGVAVGLRSGLPRPDVSSVSALTAALLGAKSIGISSGASGRYLEQLFQQLGVADQIRHKIKQPPSGTQISEMLARGEVDLGFQQVTELMHGKGFEYLGPLPAEVQNYTVWSAGVHRRTPQEAAAAAFSRALAAQDSAPAIRKHGMDPI